MPSVEIFFTFEFIITSLMFFAGLMVVWRLAGPGEFTPLRFLIGVVLYVGAARAIWSSAGVQSDGVGPAVILAIASVVINMTVAHPRWWRSGGR